MYVSIIIEYCSRCAFSTTPLEVNILTLLLQTNLEPNKLPQMSSVPLICLLVSLEVFGKSVCTI